MSGKGSKPRPLSVPQDKFDSNWDAIFKPKTKAKAKAGRPAKTAKTGGVKKPVAPKYRHPASGATWTGRGKAPLWVVEAEKNGQPRQQFLI
jgi:DNA-binding protein H-NS